MLGALLIFGLVGISVARESEASLLTLLRRNMGSTSLVVVTDDATLEARVRCQPSRPYFFAVPPIPGPEVRAILSGAVEASQRH